MPTNDQLHHHHVCLAAIHGLYGLIKHAKTKRPDNDSILS